MVDWFTPVNNRGYISKIAQFKDRSMGVTPIDNSKNNAYALPLSKESLNDFRSLNDSLDHSIYAGILGMMQTENLIG